MNKDQTTGVAERVLYAIILAGAMKLVERGWITVDMAIYLAAGGVTALGGLWAWWINRPSALLSAAGAQLPKNSALVITTSPQASPAEKIEARDLADASSDKVIAKTTA